MKVAIPRSGESVSPCFGYCAVMAIFTIVEGRVDEEIDFPLKSRDPFDRVRLLRDQRPKEIHHPLRQTTHGGDLKANGIQVISWVSGTVDDLLQLFLRGQLVERDPDSLSHMQR